MRESCSMLSCAIQYAPRDSQSSQQQTSRPIQDALREKHAPISNYFNSGIGIQLQRIDSDIAEEVMMTFLQRDILVLPVHDSFITYFAQEDALKEVMNLIARSIFSYKRQIVS